MNNVPVRGYRLVVRVVLLQAGCAALVASVFLVFKGAHQAIAALVGGLIVAAGSAVLGWRAFKPGIAGGATLTMAMYAGVALKWLWFALALYLALTRVMLNSHFLSDVFVGAGLGLLTTREVVLLWYPLLARSWF